jgi:NAD(P)H-hydrate epimerase
VPPLGGQTILTPHLGEFTRLTGMEKAAVQADWVGAAQQAQARFGGQVVLKSSAPVVATSDDRVYISPVGNHGMATAGSGDVLSGILAGLLAQGAAPPVAAPTGVYLHGLAGDEAAERLTPYAVTAGSLIEALGPALLQLLAGEEESA